MDRQLTVVYSEPIPNAEEELFKSKGTEEYGQYLLRKNYRLVKPATKYTEAEERPREPRVEYSHMSDELAKNNPQNPHYFFHNTSRTVTYADSRERHFVDRYTNGVTRHLIRGPTKSDNFCYIRKEAFNKEIPLEYTYSQHGAYPTWGKSHTGIRTRSHHVAEPVERFVNIDLYRRPPTNQPGKIIFDYGRPNNGYYLQRNQYDNTWFNSDLQLNRTGILQNIAPKTAGEYEQINRLEQEQLRAKSSIWPFITEYQDKHLLHVGTDKEVL